MNAEKKEGEDEGKNKITVREKELSKQEYRKGR